MEMLNVEGAQGGLGDLVDGVSALLPAALVSGPCLPSVAADMFVDNSTVVCSSVVGDFVVVEEELVASTVGGQQQPPLPPASCLGVGEDLRCSGESEERRQQASPNDVGVSRFLSVFDWSKSLDPEPISFLLRMVGRRRAVSQRRVREVGFDSKSPDPHTVSLTRGSPSPTAPHFQRTPPSPVLRTRHRRSPSPMLSSSPDPEECSSTEEGVSLVAAGALLKGVVLSNVAGGSRFSPLLVLSRSVSEMKVKLEGSMSTTSFGSSTLSPVTTVMLYQDSTAASVHEEERMQLVRSESSCSISSPSLNGPSSMSDGVRKMVAASGGKPRGGDSMGGAEVPGSTERLLCSSFPESIEHHGSIPVAINEGLQCADGSAVVETHRADPLHTEAVYSCGPGASVSPCIPSYFTEIIDAAMVGGGDVMKAVPNVGTLGDTRSVAAGPTGAPLFPIFAAVDIDNGGMVSVGGMVREEARVSPVVREALRSQPTDGLRQLPSSPVVPVS
ncbi:hypothetical protein Dimus_015932, partial [Dionaea muscipula]